MTASNKNGTRDSTTRQMLLDATVQIMVEDGYAGATSRRVAAKAGVNPALVHYYFPTMEDLYLAVYREGAQANLESLQNALASREPLRALWEEASEPHGTRLLLEFMALATRHKQIRSEIAAWAERWREVQATALNFILREHRLEDPQSLSPVVAAVLIGCLGHMLQLEKTLGIGAGHAETLSLIERYIDRFEMRPTRREETMRNGKPPK